MKIQCLMKIYNIKECWNVLNKASLATKWKFLNTEAYLARSTPIDSNSNEFHYYPYIISLDSCNGSIFLNDLSGRINVLNKAEDINLNVFNITAEINESKALLKQISKHYYKCRFNGRTCNSY